MREACRYGQFRRSVADLCELKPEGSAWLAAEYPTCWTPDSQALGHRLERLPFGHP